MFIEFKDLKKKRNIALLIVIFLIFSGGYLVVNNKEIFKELNQRYIPIKL